MRHQPAELAGRLSRKLSRPSWHTKQLVDGPAAMAATGWRVPKIAQRAGLTAVVEGGFFNRDEFGGSGSDADCFVELYEKLGFDGALQLLNGDFALALWDAKRETLWLARDRLGVKPLYYVEQSDLFAFASQPAALLALPGVGNTPYAPFVARFAASHYRTFDNEPDRSPYDAVRQLPAGHLLEVRGGQVRRRSWWMLRDQGDLAEPFEDLAQRYRALLQDAVARRFRAANRPAFTLSGGLDSSSVLSCAVAISNAKQQAYSSVYVDRTFDESEEIKPMLKDKVEAWHQVELGNDIDLMHWVERMVAVHDEPVATATWLSHFLITHQVAADGFGAMFGGLGGDELNAGEYEYFVCFFSDLAQAGRTAELEVEIAQWAAHHDHPIYKKNRNIALAAMERLRDPSKPGVVRPDRDRLARYVAALGKDFADISGWQPLMDHPFGSYLKNRTYQDIFRETAPCCLRAEDRQCTAAGLERYDPFFDHRLVEFMFRVPGTAKIGNGTTKMLLRAAMRNILPEETRMRIKKTGWNAPAHIWFTERNATSVRDLVGSRAFRERGIYNLPEVERLIQDHIAIVESGKPQENHAMFLWQLVNLELWLRMVDGL
jgi:asparagine synthase (glutamine-hydrolysing)